MGRCRQPAFRSGWSTKPQQSCGLYQLLNNCKVKTKLIYIQFISKYLSYLFRHLIYLIRLFHRNGLLFFFIKACFGGMWWYVFFRTLVCFMFSDNWNITPRAWHEVLCGLYLYVYGQGYNRMEYNQAIQKFNYCCKIIRIPNFKPVLGMPPFGHNIC